MKTIQDCLDHYAASVLNQNIHQFMSLYDDSVHIFDSWNVWEIKSKSEWRKIIENWFNGLKNDSSTLKVTFNDTSIFENSDIAFIHTSIRFSEFNTLNAEFRHVTNRFTFGLKRINDEWRIVHEHSSLPIDSEQRMGLFNLK